ncbi:MAG: hypothetical protein COV66_15125 [Nitrospinae bacterium CG11_big_fil_rev_8_21_14_0_20_45_15]|nr:MAG: hypothetical protein COV66_15125 [Nitrospinae bacterium CG11_big_fil_rev_8_21_14_0_20_45_15]
MDTYQIRDCCEEALDISANHGVFAGMSFLIGEKFCAEYQKLRLLSRKLRYLYPANTQNVAGSPLSIRPFQISYSLTIQENYRGIFDRIQFLENTLKHFVEEIENCFLPDDIKEFLNTYPRLEFKNSSGEDYTGSVLQEMTGQDLLSEAEDILIIEDLKRMFFSKSEN